MLLVVVIYRALCYSSSLSVRMHCMAVFYICSPIECGQCESQHFILAPAGKQHRDAMIMFIGVVCIALCVIVLL